MATLYNRDINNTRINRLVFLRSLGASKRPHGVGNLLLHLQRTAQLLHSWGADQSVCDAGLFHSIYGTASFSGLLPFSRRDELKQVIGPDAEDLVFAFAIKDSQDLFRSAYDLVRKYAICPDDDIHSLGFLDVASREPGVCLRLSVKQLIALVHISLANAIDQIGNPQAQTAQEVQARFCPLGAILTSSAKADMEALVSPLGHQIAIEVLKTLPSLLSWGTRPDILFSINKVWFSEASKRAHAALLHLDAEAKAGHLLERFGALPETARRRFITAPETCRNLMAKEDLLSVVPFIEESIAAEELSSGIMNRHALPVWTALGDRFYSPETTWAAPRLLGSIPVDAFSPYCHSSNTPYVGAGRMYTLNDISAMIDHLEKACALLLEDCNPAFEVVSSMTRVVVVLRESSEDERFGSSSWSRYIGKIALSNAHASNVSVGRLAHALIHESIHSLLYMVEWFIPLTTADGGSHKVRSPWTERLLPLPSYLHACFIWYGLWSFWRQMHRVNLLPMHEVKAEILRCAKGYLTGSILANIKQWRYAVHPAAWQAYEEIQNCVETAH